MCIAAFGLLAPSQLMAAGKTHAVFIQSATRYVRVTETATSTTPWTVSVMSVLF
jgi:hypothetical protein